MKTLAVLCNVASVAFTCLVLATDGVSRETAYIIFSVLMVLVPILTVFALIRRRSPATGAVPSTSVAVERAATIGNLLLAGLVCWAFADQYPHPSEAGFVEYAALMLLTPVVSSLVLMRVVRQTTRRANVPA